MPVKLKLIQIKQFSVSSTIDTDRTWKTNNTFISMELIYEKRKF